MSLKHPSSQMLLWRNASCGKPSISIKNGLTSTIIPVSASRIKIPSFAASKSRRYRTSEARSTSASCRDQKKMIPAIRVTAASPKIIAMKCGLPRPEENDSCYQGHRGQPEDHRDEVRPLAQRAENFLSIHLRDQKPWAAGNASGNCQDWDPAIIDAFKSSFVSEYALCRGKSGSRHWKPEFERRVSLVPEFVQEHNIIPFAAHQQRFRRAAGRGPGLDEAVEEARWIDSEQDRAVGFGRGSIHERHRQGHVNRPDGFIDRKSAHRGALAPIACTNKSARASFAG